MTLRPRPAGCERTETAVASQEARMMTSESFHFMTISGKGNLILIKQNTGCN